MQHCRVFQGHIANSLLGSLSFLTCPRRSSKNGYFIQRERSAQGLLDSNIWIARIAKGPPGGSEPDLPWSISMTGWCAELVQVMSRSIGGIC